MKWVQGDFRMVRYLGNINIIGNATVISTVLHFIVILSRMHSEVYSEFTRFFVWKYIHMDYLKNHTPCVTIVCKQHLPVSSCGTNFRFAFSDSSEAIAYS